MKLNTEILKSFRAQKALTLEEAGGLVGVTRQQWHRWENADDFPFYHMADLARVIGVAQGLLLLENEE